MLNIIRLRKPIQRKLKYFVYLARCNDGSYYTGYTNDLERRIVLHNKGNGAKYLRGKGPVELVYVKEYKYYKNALNEEKRIKKMRKEQKQELIDNYEKNNRE